jgi:hypothetical protein
LKSAVKATIEIGGLIFNRYVSLTIDSERHSPLKNLSLVFQDGDRLIYRSINENDSVSVSIEVIGCQPGYFHGTVLGIEKGNTKDQIKINAVCYAKRLFESKLVQTWSNETPESIIQYAIINACMTPGYIEQTGIVFPHFTARNSNIPEIVRNCEYTLQNSFDIDVSNYALFLDSTGAVNWGDTYDDSQTFDVDSSVNLIRHSIETTPFNHSVIETFLTPSMLHSMPIVVSDSGRNIIEIVRALKVKHSIENNKYRTFISYGREFEKFRY